MQGDGQAREIIMKKVNLPLRFVSLSVSYTLGGNGTTVKKVKRTIQNDELKETKSQNESIGNMIQ